MISLLEDGDGAVWLVRTQMTDHMGPLCRIKEEQVHCFGENDGVPAQLTRRLAQTDSGHLWVGGYAELCQWEPGSFRLYFQGLPARVDGFAAFRAIAPGRGGTLWAVLRRSVAPLRLEKIQNGVQTSLDFPAINIANSEVGSLFVDRANVLWIGTSNHGIFRVVNGRVEHFGTADGLSSDAVGEFFEDVEGTVWVLTSAGIDNFRDLHVASYSMREGLSSAGASSLLAGRDGTVWIGNYRALDSFRDGRFAAVRTGHGLPGNNVTTTFEDHLGRLWVGLDRNLYMYDRKSFSRVAHPDGSPLGSIFSITEDTRHAIWVRAADKLDRIEGLQIKEEIASPRFATSYILAADPRGGIYLGLVNGDLIHYLDGVETVIRSHETGNTSQVRDLLVEPDGAVWGTTVDELVRWKDGVRHNLGVRNGLPCDGVFALVKADSGAIWLDTRCGFVRIAASELEKWYTHPDSTVPVTTIDEFDGARPGLTSLKPQAVKTPDGKLWFVNGAILQMFDPARYERNPLPPPVHIESIVADRQSYLPGRALRLPPLTRDLEINYTAASFVARRRSSSATGWRGRIPTGRSLERAARPFTAIWLPAPTAFASWRAITTDCGMKMGRLSSLQFAQPTTRRAGSKHWLSCLSLAR